MDVPSLAEGTLASLLAAACLAAGAWILKRFSYPVGWTIPSTKDLYREAKILIIDDESDEELAHFRQLENRGFYVERWGSVLAERARRIDLDFDVVLLDNRGVHDEYGAQSGVESVAMIRRDNPYIPIFINTSYIGDIAPHVKRSLTKSRVGILSKITRFNEFEDAIISALTTARARKYFEELISERGLRDPDADITACVERNKKADLASCDDALLRSQVRRILEIARSVYTGERWKRRRKEVRKLRSERGSS